MYIPYGTVVLHQQAVQYTCLSDLLQQKTTPLVAVLEHEANRCKRVWQM